MTIVIVLLVLWIYHDIKQRTRLRLLTLRVARARDEAVAAGKMKDEFTRNMSHEIRTPLNAISGFAQLMCTPDVELSEEEKKDFALQIHNNASLLTVMFDGMLTFAEIESGQLKMRFADQAVNEFVNNVVVTTRALAGASITMVYETDLPDDFAIRTDARYLQQLLTNIIRSSFRYMQSGRLIISTRMCPDAQTLQFCVESTATIITRDAAEKVNRLFSSGGKVDAASDLAICYAIANKLNARCYLTLNNDGADSESPQGARFFIEHPV